MESVDLGNVLSKKVQVTPITVLDEPASNLVMDDPAPVEIIEPEVIEDRSEPEHGYMLPEHIAETIVNCLDGLQSWIIPIARKKMIFTDRELELLQTMDTTGGTVYPKNSPENTVMDKLLKHKEVIKIIPFDEGEKSRLVASTARYAETTEMKVSPLSGLMLAYGEVFLKRAAIFVND
ncbi:hypothetical protein [Pedobacter jeongneungensis]|uniref:hypothetical protein n=1 Tax=Pedobacter jeongneungensis TaxID=947309 RepID=UPI000469AE7B|nr:hypothetical protein [Pedobacter jeongneungensis]